MSEPKLISPLLDGFAMGDPISNHDGVRCCPAMQLETQSKYMVKVISVPASQTKLDALLLAGAFQDTESAVTYFGNLAEEIVNEAVLLQRLSRLEGFSSFENWQIVPMDEGESGYDVYLTNTYQPTLERQLRKESMTHLGAVNLGLDLCAALAVCRRSGYLFVNLKPENIFCKDNEYRICDLGFIESASLAYASLPERYISSYTAPEIADAYSSLNETMDVYSVGLILYQIYNGGTLPFEGRAPAEPLSAPAYADAQMAQIILKACDPNPEVRWQDPLQMGQTLVNYMQTNPVNEMPIVIPAEPEIFDEPAEEETELLPEDPSAEEILAEVDEALETAMDIHEEVADAYIATEEPAEEELTDEEPVEEVLDAPIEDIPEAELIEAPEETAAPAEEVEFEQIEIIEPEETNEEELAESTEEVLAEPAEEEPAEENQEESNELTAMLAQADELIAHETPDPVVVPEHVDLPDPDVIAAQEEASEAEASDEETSEQETAEENATVEDTADENTAEEVTEEAPAAKRVHRKWIAALICFLLLVGGTVGGYFFYENYYLQTVSAIDVASKEDQLIVTLNTAINDALLTVQCSDTYGNTFTQTVTDGKAIFEELKPSTRYRITVEISGFHKLIGTTSVYHVTPDQTSILNFTAATGAEDGSVILSFALNGPQTNGWVIRYQAEGEQAQSVTFTGTVVTIPSLTVGKTYTFTLEPETPLYLVGTTTISYTASNIIYAEDLTVHGFQNNAMTITWNTPADTTVESWVVRCYNEGGFDKTITVNEPRAVFADMDSSSAYTIQVTAAGMTQSVRTYISANSVSIHDLVCDNSNPNQLTVSWNFEGTAPDTGWLLLYTVDGSDAQQVIQSTTTSAVISPIVPGSTYDISIVPANGNTAFGGTTSYEAPKAERFSGYLVSAKDITFKMCKRPTKTNWTSADVTTFKSNFTIGQKASFAAYLDHEYSTSSDKITTLYVIRDAEGKIISTATETRKWTSMWKDGFGRFNIPELPGEAGTYSIEIYFNGAFVYSRNFTMK